MVIRAYHGSNQVSSPDEFDTSRELYLTDNRALAYTFGSNVLYLEVEGSKVYELDWMGCSWGGDYFPADDQLFEKFLDFASGGNKDEREYWEDNGMCVDMLADYLKSEGYNLLVLHDVMEDRGYSKTEYVALQGCSIRNCEKKEEKMKISITYWGSTDRLTGILLNTEDRTYTEFSLKGEDWRDYVNRHTKNDFKIPSDLHFDMPTLRKVKEFIPKLKELGFVEVKTPIDFGSVVV